MLSRCPWLRFLFFAFGFLFWFAFGQKILSIMSNCDALSEQFFKAFNVSKPKENDTLRPHPKYFRFTNSTDSSQTSEVGRIQNARRKEFFERIAKFVFIVLSYLVCNINLLFLGDEKRSYWSWDRWRNWSRAIMKSLILQPNLLHRLQLKRYLLKRWKKVKRSQNRWTSMFKPMSQVFAKSESLAAFQEAKQANQRRFLPNNWCCPSGWWMCPKISTPTGLCSAVPSASGHWSYRAMDEPKCFLVAGIYSFRCPGRSTILPSIVISDHVPSFSIASMSRVSGPFIFWMCSPGMDTTSPIVILSFDSFGFVPSMPKIWRLCLINNLQRSRCKSMEWVSKLWKHRAASDIVSFRWIIVSVHQKIFKNTSKASAHFRVR